MSGPTRTSIAVGDGATAVSAHGEIRMHTKRWFTASALSAALVLGGCGGGGGGNPAGPPATAAPAFVDQPQPTSVVSGSPTTLSASTSDPADALQWQESIDGTTWADLAGEVSPQLIFDLTPGAEDGHRFRVVATNAAGSTTSAVATLRVTLPAPVIMVQPADATVAAGQDARFAAGPAVMTTTLQAPMPAVRWQSSADHGASWADVAGADSTTLVVAGATLAQDGTRYRLVATNAAGSQASEAATLSVVASSARSLALLAGRPGSNGIADLAGSDARFASPTWIAADAHGNLVVTDIAAIRRIDAALAVTTIAGQPLALGAQDGVGVAAGFQSPSGVAIGPAGEVYVSDSGANEVRRIAPDSTVTTLAGGASFFRGSADGVGAAARFAAPQGLAIDRDGNLFLADTLNETIRKITPAGVVSTFAGQAGVLGDADGPAADARFTDPTAVAVGADGTVFVADSGNHAVRRIATDGTVTTLAHVGREPLAFSGFAGIGVDPGGTVYVAEAAAGMVYAVAPDGSTRTLFAAHVGDAPVDGDAATAVLGGATGIAVDAGGNVFLADTASATVRRLTPDGALATWAGALAQGGLVDGTGAAARFTVPAALAADAAGTLYVADTGNRLLRKVLPSGATTTFHAGLELSDNWPTAVAVDAHGNAIVVDQFACVVRRFTPAGAMTVIAGKVGACGTRVDGAAAAARFIGPTGVAVDAAGEIFVSDGTLIRRIATDGRVATYAGVDLPSTAYVDGPLASATFVSPSALAFDAAGDLFVAEAHSIREISAGGQVTTLAGAPADPYVLGCAFADGAGSAARFCRLGALAVDSAGTLYAADTATVRRIAPDGTVTTVLGSLAIGAIVLGADPLVDDVEGIALVDDAHLAITSENAVLVYTLP